LINQATTKIKKEVDTLKKILFISLAVILALSMGLIGCEGEGEGEGEGEVSWPDRELRTPGQLTIGVTGAMGYDQGLHAVYGAELAADDIGTFTVGTESLTVEIRSIETNEVLNPGGAAGTAAVSAEIDDCDFMIGGFRTEGVLVYREPIMTANMTYISCGAATEILQNAVLTNYDRYKYFFKGFPINEFQLSEAQSKLVNMLVIMARTAASNATYVPRIALLAEDAEWTRVSRENAQAKFIALGYAVDPDPWLVSPTATDIGTTLNEIATADPDIVYTIMSGPVGVTYGNTVGDYMPNVLSAGINVEAQRQEFPDVAQYAEGMVFLDGFAPGVNITANTAGFLADFAAEHSGKWPIYTANTYDAVGTLVEALQSEGSVVDGAVQYAPLDIVAYLEASVRTGVTGTTGVYPMWDGVTTGTYTTYAETYTDVPALNEDQVLALYPWLTQAKFSNGAVVSDWTYNSDDWTMPPFTTHDLIFGSRAADGSTWAGGIGSQWQDDGGGLEKVCIWPLAYAVTSGFPPDMPTWLAYLAGAPDAVVVYTAQLMGLWDQYGWWHWTTPGTGAPDITDWVTWMIMNGRI
jgi:branched-chain amino acid transport system substrate-binding protein